MSTLFAGVPLLLVGGQQVTDAYFQGARVWTGRKPPVLPDPATVLLEDDFEFAAGDFETYIDTHWGVVSGDLTRGSFVTEGSGTVARVLYPTGEIGGANSGVNFHTPLTATDNLTVQYQVRFDPDFEWTEGGKLPGMAGGTRPAGGTPSTEGLTARYMWHDGGGLILYLYHSEQSGTYGDGFTVDCPPMVRGEWVTLRMEIQLNDPGVRNGHVRIWVNGVQGLVKTGMKFRLTEASTWMLDHLFFSTFHGGQTPDYAPSRDNTADFGNILVTTN